MSEEKTTKKRRSRKAVEDTKAVVDTVAVVDDIAAEPVAEESADITESAPEVVEQVIEPVTELPPVEKEDAIQEVAEPAPVKKAKKEKKADPLAIGTELHLINTAEPAKLYFKKDSVKFIRYIAGTVYVWGEADNGRIPVTDNQELIGNAHSLIGWIDISSIGE